jgi:hypothetical protein
MAAKGPTIRYTRGDTAPFTMVLTRDGVALDLTGFTAIELVTNTEENPADATNEQFRMPVTIVAPATNGRLSFQPAGATQGDRQTASEAYAPTEDGYFYDLQAIDAAGEKATLLKGGVFYVDQDINKG